MTSNPAPATKRLDTARRATAYMRTWFAEFQAAVEDGEPLVLVDADAPQELFRAMDIPYVVTQWWSSVVAAKQAGPASLAALAALGYPDDADQYNAVPLGESLRGTAGGPRPWGGLPLPDLVVSELAGSTQRELSEVWARELGCGTFLFEWAAAGGIPDRWWDRLPHDWETVVGSDRLDLMEAELVLLADRCQRLSGRTLDHERLAVVLGLVNEQAEWNRRTRDLLATTVPAPVDIADTIPAVMIPQWHRGTEWARDAAEALFHEVSERVADDSGGDRKAEQLRLMWIGRGLWFDPGFVQRFRESHGAVFVWSMYLSIAADGYARYGSGRYGDDLFRTVAARFAPFADLLGTPGWADAWYVKEARLHGIDGVVHLAAPESRSGFAVTASLEAAGFPVFELDANNADARTWDAAAVTAELGRLIDQRVRPAADRRGERRPEGPS